MPLPRPETQILDSGQHIAIPECRKRRTKPFVIRNKAKLDKRKFEEGCYKCGYKGPAIYFLQPDGDRSCAQDLYVSEKKFLQKLRLARAVCYNCHREEIKPEAPKHKVSCKVVHSTPSMARLAEEDPEVAEMMTKLGLKTIDPFKTE
jgi:hypothetical protein